ncbi:MAG: UDP-glucose 4-epimerase GalE [Desulfobulbaceae bacterium]|nr:UDP-glucose 4-epimerase GalE [Desulfobulbaceae bacterium]
MNKTILVTGGAGFIGSHTCKLLKQNGYNPVAYDNLVYGHEESVKWGPLIIGDLFDRNKLLQVFKKYEPAAVIHFAAYAYVGESMVDPGKYYDNNVAGTVSLLETMREVNCKTIVFSSTCAAYGIPDSLPITEASTVSPINPYGRSKLMIEQMLADYEKAYGIKYVALRYFNAAGADLDGEIGEDHTPETHIIPLTIFAAQGKREALEIFGTDYPTEDGTAIRDYIHVSDLADAHIKSIEYLKAEQHSEIINLGTGKGNSVKELINTVSKVIGLEVPAIYKGRRPGDPPILVASADLAAEKLHWRPRIDILETIINSAWQWHKKLNN